MTDEMMRWARRNTSPLFVLIILYGAGLLCVAGGTWMIWFTGRADPSFVGRMFGLAILVAGLGFIGDANTRLAVNRTVRELVVGPTP